MQPAASRLLTTTNKAHNAKNSCFGKLLLTIFMILPFLLYLKNNSTLRVAWSMCKAQEILDVFLNCCWIDVLAGDSGI